MYYRTKRKYAVTYLCTKIKHLNLTENPNTIGMIINIEELCILGAYLFFFYYQLQIKRLESILYFGIYSFHFHVLTPLSIDEKKIRK